jgi:hypothetical protein
VESHQLLRRVSAGRCRSQVDGLPWRAGRSALDFDYGLGTLRPDTARLLPLQGNSQFTPSFAHLSPNGRADGWGLCRRLADKTSTFTPGLPPILLISPDGTVPPRDTDDHSRWHCCTLETRECLRTSRYRVCTG